MKALYFLFLIPVLLILAGCSETFDNPVNIGNAVTAQQPLQKVPIPVKARATAAAAVTLISPDPYEAYAELTGTGISSHMGVITFASSHHNNQTTIWDGEYQITGANGDSQWGTYTGLFTGFIPPATIQFEATFIVTGGSGRFEGATGTLQAHGEMDNITKDSWVEVEGDLLLP